MRIEAYSQVQQMYKTAKTDRSQKSKGSAAASDHLEISNMGRDYQVAKQAVAESADVREEIAAPLRKSIQSGTYEVSTEKFADKLLQSLKEMR